MPDHMNDLLRQLEEGPQESEDRTRRGRHTPRGRRLDYEYIEHTNFEAAYPETTRDHLAHAALDCGHHLDDKRGFGGYCQNLRGIPGRRHACHQECCEDCAERCMRCRRLIAPCCQREYEDALYCLSCHRRMRLRRTARGLAAGFFQPFVTPPDEKDEW